MGVRLPPGAHNTLNSYNSLFRFSARARREGSFPELVDLVRTIDRSATFIDSNDARFWLRKVYRRDRTEHQDWSVYLGVEKATLTALVRSWFEDRGLPIVTLRGYSSQTYVDEIVADLQRDGRPAVLLYIGDHDPSGKDIERDLQKRTGAFDKVDPGGRASRASQPVQPQPRSGHGRRFQGPAFMQRHGRLVKVEVEALDPNDLRDLITDELEPFWNAAAFEASLLREQSER